MLSDRDPNLRTLDVKILKNGLAVHTILFSDFFLRNIAWRFEISHASCFLPLPPFFVFFLSFFIANARFVKLVIYSDPSDRVLVYNMRRLVIYE